LFSLALMTLVNLAVADAQTTFTDLQTHAADRPAISSIVAQGIMHGVSPTQFRPDSAIERGNFAVSMQHMFNLPVPTRKVNFTDVPTSSPIYKAVEAVAPFLGRQMRCFGCALGSTFGPNEPVTRLEMAVTITNILIANKKIALLSPSAAEAALKDMPDTAALRGPVRVYAATALQEGIIARTSSNELAPALQVTRANLAVQLDHIQKKFNIPHVQP
jgi:hypothetical protein